MQKIFLLTLLLLPLGIAKASVVKQVFDEETIVNILRTKEESLSSYKYEATIETYIPDVNKFLKEYEGLGIGTYDPNRDTKKYIKVGFNQQRFIAIQKDSDLEVQKAYNGEDFKIYSPENKDGKITSIYREYRTESLSVALSESIANVTVTRLLGLVTLREWLLSPSEYSFFVENPINDNELSFRLIYNEEKSTFPELQVILDKTKDYAVKEQTYYSRDDSKLSSYGVTKFEKVDDIWIPVEGVLNSYALRTAKSEVPLYYYAMRVTDLSVNKPIEDSFFEIEFPIGTHVENKIAGITYTVEESILNYLPPPSIVGKSLPDINDVVINYSHKQAKGKPILICFFDYEQRPSRNCIIQLSKRAQELKSQDFQIIAIQASKIEQDTLDEWLKENNISFQVGMIGEDEEQTKFNWGVKSLPWLILTNAEHIITAEGFSVNEIGEKIQ